MIYWFFGQPGAGKTTLALALKAVLEDRGAKVVHLDGEFLREITDNLDFSDAGRIRNIKAGQRLAAKLHADGVTVVASFVSPYRELREAFKSAEDVLEIYVHTTAIRGKEARFARDFEPPERDFVDLDTTAAAVADCVGKILHAAARRRG